jgi:peptidoglycan/LPS O-acetylase OafA/YrhL
VRRALWVALVIAALAAGVGVYVTSDRPDGLERVTIDLRVGEAPAGNAAGDGKPAAPRARARRAALAVLGALAVAGVALGAGRLLGRGRRPPGREG